jgi:hypothetical protein
LTDLANVNYEPIAKSHSSLILANYVVWGATLSIAVIAVAIWIVERGLAPKRKKRTRPNSDSSSFIDGPFDLYDHLYMTIGNQLPGITKTSEDIAKWGGTSWPHDFMGN